MSDVEVTREDCEAADRCTYVSDIAQAIAKARMEEREACLAAIYSRAKANERTGWAAEEGAYESEAHACSELEEVAELIKRGEHRKGTS